MSEARVRVRDVRDGVLLADYPDAPDELANRLCVFGAKRIRKARLRGLYDAVPAARSLLVVFDPLRLSRERLRREIESRSGADSEGGARRTLIVPVAYDGPDLDELARAAGMSGEELARRHGEAEYRVAFLGFAPGFAYLTGLPASLAAPRLESPRARVPAGSVAIGGTYSAIYPAQSPGGWRLIGRTTIRLFDAQAQPPALLRTGDRVRFERVRPEDLPRLAPESQPAPRGEPVLQVLAPGLATTVQGAPLDGLRSSGVPPGGAMDPVRLALANALAGNADAESVLEIALAGPELEVLRDCAVAAAGGLEVAVNGEPAGAEMPLRLVSGDRLRLGRVRGGVWGYLAVSGGLVPLSRLAPQRRLAVGDRLAATSTPAPAARSSPAPPPDPAGPLRLRVLEGPESAAFTPEELARFFESPWRVATESDRRGLRLEGEPLAHRGIPEILPSGTVPGSVQVPGRGLPIVLGPDGPVTGGYPRIATVIGADLPLLGRAALGAVLRFVPVTLAEALEARRSLLLGVR